MLSTADEVADKVPRAAIVVERTVYSELRSDASTSAVLLVRGGWTATRSTV